MNRVLDQITTHQMIYSPSYIPSFINIAQIQLKLLTEKKFSLYLEMVTLTLLPQI